MAIATRETPYRAMRLLPLAAAVLLGGCISFGPKTPEQLISLTPAVSAPVGDLPTPGTGTTATPAIVVLDPETERSLDVLRVPVRVSSSGVAYVKDAAWIAKPARQFRALLAETLRAQGRRMVLEGLDSQADTRAVLGGRLLDMGYDAVRGTVVVRYDALLTLPGGAIRARRFQAEVPGIAATAAAVGPALNQAANDVAGQVAAWAS